MTKFLGPDKVWRTMDEHLEYLKQCVRMWEQGTYSFPASNPTAHMSLLILKIKEEA